MNADPPVIRLLLVEDNPTDTFLLKAALSRAHDVHFELLTAERLSDAIAVLHERSIDVILTDLNLPDSTGVETIARLTDKTDGLPIIALTGSDDPALAGRLIDEGACCCWSKDQVKRLEFANMIEEEVQRCSRHQERK